MDEKYRCSTVNPLFKTCREKNVFKVYKQQQHSSLEPFWDADSVIIYGLEHPLFQIGFVVDIWTHKCVNNVQTFKGLVHYLQCCSILFKKNQKEDVTSSML